MAGAAKRNRSPDHPHQQISRAFGGFVSRRIRLGIEAIIVAALANVSLMRFTGTP